MSAATRWTIAIVGLLVGNVLAMVFLATVATRSDAQVIPNYYEKASHYDDTLAEARRSQQLAWATRTTLVDGTVEVAVRDAGGLALDGAKVRVSGYQRSRAKDTYELELTAGGPGVYRAAVIGEQAGVHDVTVVVERDGQRFTDHVVVEAR